MYAHKQIFLSNFGVTDDLIQSVDSQNPLVRSIPGSEDLDIGGAVLVAKSHLTGEIANVLQEDIPLISRMLVE